MSIPSSQAQLKELILNALRADYIARSCKDDIETGNRYQSVRLGDDQTSGFRTDRREFLSQIDFRGKKVLDLGSNLGEISRTAREMGAYLVDGFEYDPYFLEIARMVNAYNEITRVSFYQRDITDPSIYQERYDIVLAFAVFEYIHTVLGRIAASADQLFVLETHRLDDNLESAYIGPVSRHFPYYKILGESEWGAPHDRSERRAVIAFAKQPAALAAVSMRAPLSRERLKPSSAAQSEPSRKQASVDLRRTDLHQRFYSTFEFDAPDELLRAIGGLSVDLASLARSRDARVSGYHGWVYWLIYLKGYLQYLESGVIGHGNVYFDYVTDHLVEIGPDRGLAQELRSPLAALERITRRFRDLDFFSRGETNDTGEYVPDPLRLLVGDVSPEDGPRVYFVDEDAPFAVRLLDGWHRLFAARLAGVQSLPCEVVREPAELPRVQGAIDDIRFDGSRLTISGWCAAQTAMIHAVEVRSAGHVVGRAVASVSADISDRHQTVANPASFVAECHIQPSTESVTRLDVLPLHDWLPIGALSVYCLPRTSASTEVTHLPLRHDAIVAVVSKGDDELLRLLGRGARHFPETHEGVYAGYHPADSDEAIVQLEAMRARGTEYLLFPRTSLWWLDHYADFRRYLEQRYQVVVWQEDGCVIFDLREVADSCREG